MTNSGLVVLRGWRRTAELPKVLPECSLLVPTYRRPGEVVALLEALEAIPDAPGEVIVVDGSGEDPTDAAVAAWARTRRLRFDLGLVRSPAGLTRQRNVGLDASSGRLVYFLDDDCRPEPGYFEALRRVFEEDRSGSVGAVAGTIVNEIGGPIGWRWRIRLLLRLVPPVDPGRVAPTATSVPLALVGPFRGTREVDMVPGGASAWRREVFQTHRYSLFFDGYAQGEDLEMSLRIGRSWRLLWSGDAPVAHHHAPGGRPRPRWKGRMEVRNRFFIWKRHLPNVRFRDRLLFWLDIAYVLACDVGYFVGGRGFEHLRHAAGVLEGSGSCVIHPPRWEELPARREYLIEWDPAPEMDASLERPRA